MAGQFIVDLSSEFWSIFNNHILEGLQPIMAPKPELAINHGTATTQAKRVTRPRSPSKPKTVFAVLQVLDEHGQPTEFPKSRINILGFEKDGLAVMDKVEANKHAIHIRGQVPAGR